MKTIISILIGISLGGCSHTLFTNNECFHTPEFHMNDNISCFGPLNDCKFSINTILYNKQGNKYSLSGLCGSSKVDVSLSTIIIDRHCVKEIK